MRSVAIRAGLVAAGLTAVVGLIGAACPTAANSETSKTIGAAAQTPANYVGEDTCLTCHDKQVLNKGRRCARIEAQRQADAAPADSRVRRAATAPERITSTAGGDKTKILNPKNMDARAASDTCTTCHNRKTHAFWEGSQHDQRNVSCISCHSVHSAKGPSQIKAANELALCATCHRSITNKQARFNHMPVREGKLGCSSCHNVHGSQNIKAPPDGDNDG